MNQNIPPSHTPANTIDEVLAQLDEIIDHSISSHNYLFVFAFVYRRTTQKIKEAIEGGRFEDGKRMEKMDVIFANLYIQAYYDYQASKSISKSWEFAFASKNANRSLIQHILLGMNVHINLDLSIAAADVAKGREIIGLKNDFMTINQILAELTNTMQKSLGKASFLLKLLDLFGFKNDEKMINFSIRKARNFAWLNAMELALIEGNLQKARIAEVDKRVLELSKMIKNPPGKFLFLVMKTLSLFELKDPKKIFRKLR